MCIRDSVVLVCALTDAVLAVAVANLPGLGLEVNGVVLPVVLVWYIFTELGSIAENAAAMGAPVPGWLVRILAQGKDCLLYTSEALAFRVGHSDRRVVQPGQVNPAVPDLAPAAGPAPAGVGAAHLGAARKNSCLLHPQPPLRRV